MRILLSEIKGMERRVRKSQSPEKLEELAESLKETGQIVPVKVRKNGRGYTLVYGHRRVAASKMAGMKDIEAIVEDVAEDKLLTQALVENVVREDMAAIDIAKALRTIVGETNCTQEALGKKLGWHADTVGHYLRMLDPELGLNKSEKPAARRVGVSDVKEALAGTGGDAKLAGQVLEAAAKEELSTRDTRKVAEVVRRASEFGGEKAVQRVLAQPAAQILASAPTIAPRKPSLTVRKSEAKVAFQWTKDTRVIFAEEGLKAVSACVSAIARSNEDRGGGKVVLKRLRTMTANVLKQIDAVLR